MLTEAGTLIESAPPLSVKVVVVSPVSAATEEAGSAMLLPITTAATRTAASGLCIRFSYFVEAPRAGPLPSAFGTWLP
jgi:hypothetical protein